MKLNHLLLACFFLLTASMVAQDTYTINGTSYTLKTEVSGPLTLLWNTVDGEYRYFSKKGGTILELRNTRKNGQFQEEYKAILQSQTADASVNVSEVKLTVPSLRSFFITYNKQVDPNYAIDTPSVALKTRLGGFVGGTNYVYATNPDNSIIPQFGVEWEIYDEVKLRRHALVLQFRQLLGTSDYDFSSSQFSLNYRFKFIKSAAFDFFVNTKIVNYIVVNQNVEFIDDSDELITLGNYNEFLAPFALGIGADIALGNGYLTVAYNDIVALNLNNNDEFPVDFTVGYKFNL
ncbi:hypothetical protein [Altibacter sp. HG106]|uniref:hypothetical protein n=1 Tax=Altibacter sp. HG106 TaxID=3023937 RepID=UPI00234FE2C3|nr:hypothetical protein [Altibacter sp. HG106]MDC7994068.1 hypothetical protein [Altibacter sp. HG106]